MPDSGRSSQVQPSTQIIPAVGHLSKLYHKRNRANHILSASSNLSMRMASRKSIRLRIFCLRQHGTETYGVLRNLVHTAKAKDKSLGEFDKSLTIGSRTNGQKSLSVFAFTVVLKTLMNRFHNSLHDSRKRHGIVISMIKQMKC